MHEVNGMVGLQSEKRMQLSCMAAVGQVQPIGILLHPIPCFSKIRTSPYLNARRWEKGLAQDTRFRVSQSP